MVDCDSCFCAALDSDHLVHIMKPVKSSQIHSIGHDGKQLSVKFHSGATYDYPDCPQETYDMMMALHGAGQSIGKLFHLHVKQAGFAHKKRD